MPHWIGALAINELASEVSRDRSLCRAFGADTTSPRNCASSSSSAETESRDGDAILQSPVIRISRGREHVLQFSFTVAFGMGTTAVEI